MNARVTHYVGHQILLVTQILFLLFFLQLFVVDFGRVNGISMEPTLRENQFFVVNRFSLLFRDPRRYEIIQFFHPEQEDVLIIKRVIGLPGEFVEILPGQIRVTRPGGQTITLDESYLPSTTYTEIKPGWSNRFIVPEHTFVVLGDNRAYSVDSREYGSIHRRQILGTVYVTVQGNKRRTVQK